MASKIKGPAVQNRPLYEIAGEIGRSWEKVYFGAVPYLNAMAVLNRVSDTLGEDDGESIVIYFLSNATGWRGEDARRIKNELKAMLPERYR